jgi:hypothetical protein
MCLNDPAIVSNNGKTTLLPALVCSGLCIVLMRAGFLSFLFLVPLGFCAAAYGSAVAWLGLLFTILGNGVVSTVISLFFGGGLASAGLDILFFSLLVLGFTWIMAGNPPENSWISLARVLPRIRTLFRFTIASIVAASMLIGMILVLSGDGGLSGLTLSQIESFSFGLIASAGADAARQSLLENAFTADKIINLLTAFILRGGALISAFFLFFINRQVAFLLVRLFKRKKTTGDLAGFHVPRKVIWVFSLCLPVILAGRALSLSVIEIGAWNVLVICAIMYLAQGGGIVLYTLTYRPIPMLLRLAFLVLFVFLVFSPGLNVLALMVLVLLGIAENWLPMRIKNKDPVT